MSGLSELYRVLIQEKSLTSAAFLSNLQQLFSGLRSCLLTIQLQQLANGASMVSSVTASQASQNNNQISENIVEIVLKANQILFEMMPDIQHSEELEIQMAQLISIFIENLGSPKAIVRKSTHKCIGTYVKLTKKLEFVMLHIIHTGLENSNSRTRQHSMLVIPALLSLKQSVIESECKEMKDLIQAVLRRIKTDQSEIVSKTGKKLLLELQKCYPQAFQNNYVDKIRSGEEKAICQAVFTNDENLLKQIVNGSYKVEDSSRESQKPAQNPPVAPGQNLILDTKEKDLDKIIIEAKRESRYPTAQNGLLFSFLQESQVEALNENHQWKERTNAIEAIENELNQLLSVTDRKIDFLPFSTPFLGFIVQYIKDINFKISITAINITSKLLVMNLININKYYSQLVTTLIEKLSDSKVVIRQAVLRCCSLLIKNYDPGMFAQHSIKFIRHTNWHVREGILHLIANSIIVQNQQEELGGSPENSSENIGCNAQLIQELVLLAKSESKQKLYVMSVDCLALCLEASKSSQLTDKLILHELGVSQNDIEQNSGNKNVQIYKLIKERLLSETLPTMQIDGLIEFKPEPEPQVQATQLPPLTVSSVPIIETNVNKSPSKVSDKVQMQMRFQQERIANEELANNRQHSLSAIQQETKKIKQEIPKYNPSAEGNKNERQIDQPPNLYDKKSLQKQQSEYTRPVVQTNLKTEIEDQYISPLKSAMIGKNQDLQSINSQGIKSQILQQNKPAAQEQNKDEKISLWLPKFQESAKQEQKTPNTNQKTLREDQQASPLLKAPSHNQPKIISSNSIQNTGAQSIFGSDSNLGSNKYQPIDSYKASTHNTDIKPQLNRQGIQAASPLIKGQQNNNINNNYTPEQHSYQPRQIQSNQLRQRALENNMSLSQASPSPKSKLTVGNGLKNDFISIQQSPMITDPKSRISQNPNQQKNMSQSSGAPGGFNVNKTMINERLQLLKSTFKYKNTSEHDPEVNSFDTNESQLRNNIVSSQKLNYNNQRGNTSLQANGNTHEKLYTDPQHTLNSFGHSNVSTNVNNNSNLYSASKNFSNQKQPLSQNTTTYGSGGQNAYSNLQQHRTLRGLQGTPNNQKSVNSAMGPVKAMPPQNDFMNTIQVNNNQNKTETNSYGAHQQMSRRAQKPPVVKTSNISLPVPQMGTQNPQNQVHRASSVTYNDNLQGSVVEERELRNQNKSQNMSPYPTEQQSASTTYNAPEEPLRNPEQQFKQSIQNLKSDDWQKIFDSLNIIKRVALFHKEILASPGQKEAIKLIVKQTDNLRSQVSKNACMALQVLFQELPTKDLDPSIDLVLGALIKKATDTNQFVSEQAEKALIMVCHACNESKVFNSLQSQNIRANNMKQKTCMCYNNLISKLGIKIKGFREQERLVKAVIMNLKEGAQEVRQTAKLGVLTLKNSFSNSREFDQFLLRCNLTDQQIEQARKVIEQEDYESLSNYAGTRYGGSMRGSSMDSRSAADAQRRTPYAPPGRRGAAGSDGFQQSSFLESKMTSTFLSGGGMPSQVYSNNSATQNGFGMTGSSNQAFKKRQPSVSKPVDPKLMEQFQTIIAKTSVPDWNSRLQSIDNLTNWISEHSISIKQTQPSKFIQLVDTECKLIQDNNAKVQMKALNHFSAFLVDQNLRQLIDQNLTMIIQAISNNLASTSPSVRNQSNQHLQILEDSTESMNQLVQPMVVQINLPNNRSKAQLLDRLSNLIPKIDSNTINKYIAPLLKSNNKIQNEATVNPKVRDALNSLEQALQ